METDFLVIEDDLSHCKYIEIVLKQNQYTCKIVHDIANAMEALTQEKFALTFLDLTLPDGHGFEVLDQINQKNIGTPVAVTSAMKDPDAIIKSFRLGAVDYLIKPISEEVLLSTIQSVQKKKEGDMPLLQRNLNFVSEQKTLTPREFQVLGLIASGENYKNISEKLFISQNTFKVHLKKIFQKLLLNGRTEVVYQFNCSDIRKHFNKPDSGFN